MRGLLPRDDKDAGFRLLSVKVETHIDYLLASSIVNLCYKNVGNESQCAKFQWVGGYPLPYYQHVSINGSSRTAEIDSPIIDEENNIYQNDSSMYSPLKYRLHSSTVDVGNVPAQTAVTITLGFIDQLSVHWFPSSETVQQSRLIYTLPTSITSLFESQVVNGPGMNGGMEERSCQFVFQSSLRMPSQICKLSSTYNQYNQTLLSRDQRSAQLNITCDYQHDQALQIEILLRKPPQLHGQIESLSKKTNFASGKDCLALSFVPDFTGFTGKIETKTEVMLLVDRSKRVTEPIMQQFAEVILLFLKSIPEGCLFQIMGYGARFETLFTAGSSEYNPAAVTRALRYHEEFKNDMGSANLYSALQYALTTKPSLPGWDKQILVLVAGGLEHIPEVSGLLASYRHKAKLYLIGVGPLIHQNALGTIARSGQAEFEHLSDPSAICETFLRMLNRALQPRATRLHMKFTSQTYDPSVTVTIPRDLPPVNWGDGLLILLLFPKGKFKSVKGAIELSYDIGEQEKTATLDLSQVQKFVHENRLVKLPLFQLANQRFSNEQTCIYGTEMDETMKIHNSHAWNHSHSADSDNIKPEEQILVESAPKVKTAPPKQKSKENTRKEPQKSGFSKLLCCQSTPKSPIETPKSDFPTKPVDPVETANVVQLAKIQSFDGFWQLDQSVCECLAIRLEQIETMIPKLHHPEAKRLWATALVLCYLQVNRLHQSDTWDLSWNKGMSWLNDKYSSLPTTEQPIETMKDDLLTNARSALYACRCSYN